MKKKVLLVVAVAALMVFASLALGQGINPYGQPDLKKGEGLGYKIWKDDKGWHLRWTTAENRHFFVGSIEAVGGEFVGAKRVGAGKKDKVTITKALIKFDARAEGGSDGIDFRLSAKVTKVRFDLKIDGKARPDRVFIGRSNQAAPANPFEIENK